MTVSIGTTTVVAVVLALAVAALVAVAPSGPARMVGASRMGAAQEVEIEKVVRRYLREHPEVLVEAIQALQARNQAPTGQQTDTRMTADRAELVNDPDTPVMGNPSGDVVVVEFFDYRCPYCKRVLPSLMEIMAEDKGIRLAMKEWPILGPDSVAAARAALAAWRADPGTYERFHVALMQAKDLTADKVLRLAEQIGIDPEKLGAGMAASAIDIALQKNMRLAESLGITGTPTFFVGRHLVPGAIDKETLRRLVAEAREACRIQNIC